MKKIGTENTLTVIFQRRRWSPDEIRYERGGQGKGEAIERR